MRSPPRLTILLAFITPARESVRLSSLSPSDPSDPSGPGVRLESLTY
jgi:hypothetical protein